MKKSNIDFGKSHLLGSDLPPERTHAGSLEGTITHPLTDGWSNAVSSKQKSWYVDAFRSILVDIPPEHISSKTIVMEHHKNGHLHAHFSVVLNDSANFFIAGLLSDIAKRYHSLLPKQKFKRWHIYNETFLYMNMNRYCSAPITLQYRYVDELRDGRAALTVWHEYMLKAQ